MERFTNLFNKNKHRTQAPFSKEIDEMVQQKIRENKVRIQSKKDEFDSNLDKYIKLIMRKIVKAKIKGERKINITVVSPFEKLSLADREIGEYAALEIAYYINKAVGRKVVKGVYAIFGEIFIEIRVDKI